MSIFLTVTLNIFIVIVLQQQFTRSKKCSLAPGVSSSLGMRRISVSESLNRVVLFAVGADLIVREAEQGNRMQVRDGRRPSRRTIHISDPQQREENG